jgi:hypothetical protein
MILGFRPHTGWCAVVGLEGTATRLRVVLRGRVELLIGPDRFVYHRAAKTPAVAAKLLADARKEAAAAARAAIHTLIGKRLAAGAVISIGNLKLPAELGWIFAAHTRLHAAEGVFYREIVATGCAALGLETHLIPERDIPILAARHLAISANALAARLKQLGSTLGPPWGEDQRLAAMAALIHSPLH